jgi:hypothetical protein
LLHTILLKKLPPTSQPRRNNVDEGKAGHKNTRRSRPATSGNSDKQ